MAEYEQNVKNINSLASLVDTNLGAIYRLARLLNDVSRSMLENCLCEVARNLKASDERVGLLPGSSGMAMRDSPPQREEGHGWWVLASLRNQSPPPPP